MNSFSPARCSWRITRSSFPAHSRDCSQNRLYCNPSGWIALYSCQSKASVTFLPRSSRRTSLQSGSGRDVWLDGSAGNSRRSSPASSSASGTAQLTPATLARRRCSPTVDGDVPRLRAIARMLNAAAKYSEVPLESSAWTTSCSPASVPPAKAGRIPRRRGCPASLSPD